MRICFTTFILAFFLMVAADSHSANEADRDPAYRAPSNGLLFVLQKQGRRSYLLGTVHAGYSEAQRLGKNIISAIDASSTLYVEADLNRSEQNSDLIERYGFPQDGSSLRDLIGDAYYNDFRTYWVEQQGQFTEEKFERMRPWLLAMMTPLKVPPSGHVLKLEYGSDEQAMLRAQEKHIPVKELEGIERQLRFYQGMDETAVSAYFSAFIQDIKNQKLYEFENTAIEAWTAGDRVALEKNWAKWMSEHDAYCRFYVETMIERRNDYFAKTIAELAQQQGGAFFAVGEDHLPGETGLLKQLARRGFRITAVMTPKK